jgi:type II secretory pathway pseudopilin PulG
MRRTQPYLRRTAFTLAEALVVVGIIFVLVSFLFIGLSKMRDSSRRAVCANNLRQVGVALTAYASSNDKQLPVCPGPASSMHWLNDISFATRDALMAAGLPRDSFYCPSGDMQNDDKLWWWPTGRPQDARYCVTGYFWLMYRADPYGNPYRFSQSPGEQPPQPPPPRTWKWLASMNDRDTDPTRTVLVADSTMSYNGNFAGIPPSGSPLPGRSNHLQQKSPTKAWGGNTLYLDNHVEWRDLAEMQIMRHPSLPAPGHDEWF